MRLGIIVRCDNSGLGILSYEHVKYLNPDKVLVVKIGRYKQFSERYPKAIIGQGIPTDDEIRLFLTDLDICLTFETPYNWHLYKIAREMGVKTICQCNYEWLNFCDLPDLFQCVSTWHYDKIPGNKILVPCPVSREIIPFRKRYEAKTFLHIAGHKDALYGRNGTVEFMQAITKVKSDVKFIIYSQSNFDVPNDIRIDYKQGDFNDYSSLYHEGDILVYPRRYGGQSLQLNEALSSGMPVLMTNMEPQNEFLPKEWLIEPSERKKIKIRQSFDICICSPEVIATKIDEWAGKDIELFSNIADSIANKLSWNTLIRNYKEMFASLLKC